MITLPTPIGDDATDAFTAAIAEADGEPIFVPPGKYRARSLNVSGAHLVGCGSATVIAGTAGASHVLIAHHRRCTVERLTVACDGAESGVVVHYAAKFRFDQVTVHGGRTGWLLDNAQVGHLSDCYAGGSEIGWLLFAANKTRLTHCGAAACGVGLLAVGGASPVSGESLGLYRCNDRERAMRTASGYLEIDGFGSSKCPDVGVDLCGIEGGALAFGYIEGSAIGVRVRDGAHNLCLRDVRVSAVGSTGFLLDGSGTVSMEGCSAIDNSRHVVLRNDAADPDLRGCYVDTRVAKKMDLRLEREGQDHKS